MTLLPTNHHTTMFKQASIFKITLPQPMLTATLDLALSGDQFKPVGLTQDHASGWVPPRGHDHGAMVENIGGHLILRLKIETKTVPASAIAEAVAAEVKAIETNTGRKPGKKETRELKDEARLALLPHAFPRASTVTGWIDPARGLLVLDTASTGKTDEFITALFASIEGIKINYLETASSPRVNMTNWLSVQDPLIGGDVFIIGRACELKADDESKAVVRYTRHSLDTDEVRQHIAHGKSATKLALTWNDRVSFTLTESGCLAGIEFLEPVFESTGKISADEFDASVAIMTGELGVLIDDLVAALGGEAA